MSRNPLNYSKSHKNYNRIAKAIAYLCDHRASRPGLSELSEVVGLSEYHLQRVFSEWAGVSPNQFLQYLTKEYAMESLKETSVMDASYATGLSGPSRLHDLMLSCEGVTPGEYKQAGQGLEIAYGIHPSPFGQCFIASTGKGICKLSFFDRKEEQAGIELELASEWPGAKISRNNRETEKMLEPIFGVGNFRKEPLGLLMKGTKFQLKVWEALLAIPPGKLMSYQQVATSMGEPSAVRAVASAVGRNNISFLIPCHRVIRKTGEFGQYRQGPFRKQAMIGWEGCQAKTRKEEVS